jgi:hypothetical protein
MERPTQMTLSLLSSNQVAEIAAFGPVCVGKTIAFVRIAALLTGRV